MTLGITGRTALTAADVMRRRPFLRRAKQPRRAQERTLDRIVKANAETEFGQAHGFSAIQSRDAYRAAVPVQTYDDFAAAVEKQAATGAAALTTETPTFYARTSGTTGPARDFPVTPKGEAAQRLAQQIFAATLFRGTGLFDGQIAGFSGAHVEGIRPTGQPYGSASGQTYATSPKFIRDKFVVPEAVFAIPNADQKRHAYALSTLAAADLTGMITANPSTLLSLANHLDQHQEAVLRDLRDGTFSFSAGTAIQAGLGRPASPERVRQVETALKQKPHFGALWPRLNCIATWTGGNCRVALDQLAPALPAKAAIVEIGYRASEFVGALNVDAAANLCLPDVDHVVFEFVEEGRWERGDQAFLWLDELVRGARYYVFATTLSGLYRYNINDVIEVSGMIGGCPTLEFVRKGQDATSITGEKLYAEQAIGAIRGAAAETHVPPAFHVLVADAPARRYRLFYEIDAAPSDGLAERFASTLDRALAAANIEYADKRASSRLREVEVAFMRPGSGAAISAAAIDSGQREAQLKLPILVDATRWPHDMAPYCRRPRG